MSDNDKSAKVFLLAKPEETTIEREGLHFPAKAVLRDAAGVPLHTFKKDTTDQQIMTALNFANGAAIDGFRDAFGGGHEKKLIAKHLVKVERDGDRADLVKKSGGKVYGFSADWTDEQIATALDFANAGYRRGAELGAETRLAHLKKQAKREAAEKSEPKPKEPAAAQPSGAAPKPRHEVIYKKPPSLTP